MLKKIITIFKELDPMTYKIMKHGLQFCFILCLSAAFILITYHFAIAYPLLYYIGINLFRISLIFGIEFIICGIVVDGIKKQIV